MLALKFSEPIWNVYVNRGCINGTIPPGYVVGSNFIHDPTPGSSARIKMVGGSMTMPPQQSRPRSLFFTYQNCAGVTTIIPKSSVVSLVIWFQRPRARGADPRWRLPRFSTVKVVLAPSIDPISTLARVVNVYGSNSLIATRAVPENGNTTLSLGSPTSIAAVEIQTNHIENNLKAVLFLP